MTAALAKAPEVLEGEPVAPTVALALRPVDTKDLDAKKAQAERSLAQLNALPCDTEEQVQAFADFLQKVLGITDVIETTRKNHTAALHAEKTRIDKLFKPCRDAWEACEKVIRAKLQTAAQRRLDAQREAHKLAAEAAAKGDVGAAVAALAKAPERAVISGVRNGEEWELAEYDIASVPREWLTIDWSKVKIYLRDHQNSPEIPPVAGFVFRRKAKVAAK